MTAFPSRSRPTAEDDYTPVYGREPTYGDTTAVVLDELAVLRRETADTKQTVVRADLLVRGFVADLKRIGNRLEADGRLRILQSTVAYVLFALLCAGGAFVVVRLQAALAARDTAETKAALAAAVDELASLKTRDDARRLAEVRAENLYALIERGAAEEAVREFEAMDVTLLPRTLAKLLEDQVGRLRRTLGAKRFDEGRRAYLVGSYRNAILAVDHALRLAPELTETADAYFFKGVSLYKTGDHPAAVANLERALELKPTADKADFARYVIGLAMEDGGNVNGAVEYYRRAVDRNPGGPYAGRMTKRMRALLKATAGR